MVPGSGAQAIHREFRRDVSIEPRRHCEVRSDEAIQEPQRFLDCFVALRAPRNDGTHAIESENGIPSMQVSPRPMLATASAMHP